jgi:hypothetical protein
MTREEYIALYERYVAGEATPEEVAQLLRYEDDFEMDIARAEEATDEEKETGKRILAKINQSAGMHVNDKRTPRIWWYAAAAVLVCTIGAVFFNRLTNKTKTEQVASVPHDILPGRNKAMLRLANGKVISLDDAVNGTIAKQEQTTVEKKSNGQLTYIAPVTGKTTENVTPEINTVSTPRGGQYQVVLPDGTKVWLNAATSLKFPTAFTSKTRNVELTGEAYFEVAKNKNMPFIVKFNDDEVQVLGTHFDIKAYKDDNESSAVLAEGSIRFTKNNTSRLLIPGQQAVDDNTDAIKVSDANVEEALAWKNGLFIFHDTSIKDIMKNAARWYDIDVAYEAGTDNTKFGGRISRYKNMSELLKNLELTETVHFKVEGRRVTVMK